MGKLTGFVEKQNPEETILDLLQVRFSDPNDPDLVVRKELLLKTFNTIDSLAASSLYTRLSNKKSNEKVVVLFYHKLSSSLSLQLLEILKVKSEQARQLSQRLQAIKPVNKTPVNKSPLPKSNLPVTPKRLNFDTPTLATNSFQTVSLQNPDEAYQNELRSKIARIINAENSRIKGLAKSQFASGSKEIIPGSHEWDDIEKRLLFFRYYFEAYFSTFNTPISGEQFIDKILAEELEFQKTHGLNYRAPFPTKDHQARFGSVYTDAADQRDYRCGVSHHRYGSPPDPVKFEREPTPLEIFWMILKQLNLTEQQYYDLNDQILQEKFTDDEINFIFSAPYIYKQYIIAGKKTTLREYIKNWQKYQEYIKKYGDPNEAYRRFVKVHPATIKSAIFTAAGNEATVALYEVLKKLKEVYEKVAPFISLICDFIPYVGPIKALIEGVAGVDIITGDELAGWQRVLAVLPFGIEHSGTIVKGMKQVTKAAASAAKTPQVLVILTLACKSGKHPVDVIQSMKAIATMSEHAITAARDEAKVVKAAKALKVTETQAEALKEVRKTVDKIKAAKPMPMPSAKPIASQVQAAATAAKHIPKQPLSGVPNDADKATANKITSPTPKPAPKPKPDKQPALPAKERKPKRRARQRRQLWFRFPNQARRIFDALQRLSKRGYQVYVLKDSKGVILYVGKSGGATGLNPKNWLDRLVAHIKDVKKEEWIGEVDKISVRSNLSEMEAFALEETLIDLSKATNKNISPGEFTTRFGAANKAANYQSALKKVEYNFEVDIVQ